MNRDKNINKSKQLVYVVWVGDYCYCGSGKYERLSGNTSKLRRGVHANSKLQEAYNNIKDLKIEVLEFNIEDDITARDLENQYMEHFRKIDGVIICNKYPACVNKRYERKLDANSVANIRKLISEGKSNMEIANMFNVNESTISRVKTGRRWSCVA